MESVVASRLQSLEFGAPQTYRKITVVPLLAPDGAYLYRTLPEALTSSDVTITEISQAGSVPELQVVNRGPTPVLMVDGEELSGAKQNRVINTSILLPEKSETRIPVSCTEQGRWAYSSAAFSSSGNVMAQKARASKSRSVSRSLDTSTGYKSDQGEVWREISRLQAKSPGKSPTSAMYDVFKALGDELHRCMDTIQCVPGQVGLLAFSAGRPTGFDVVSRSAAYAHLHSLLVRSYALESVMDDTAADAPALDFVAMARDFVAGVIACEERQFRSLGCGSDHRYRGTGLTGAALVHAGELIHSAFFHLDAARPDAPHPETGGDLVSLLRRNRAYRDQFNKRTIPPE